MPSGIKNERTVRAVHQTKRMNSPSSAKNFATAPGRFPASLCTVSAFAGGVFGCRSEPEAAGFKLIVGFRSVAGFGSALGLALACDELGSAARACSAASFAACAMSRSKSIPLSAGGSYFSTNWAPIPLRFSLPAPGTLLAQHIHFWPGNRGADARPPRIAAIRW